MQIRSRLPLKLAVVFIGILLAVSMFLIVFSSHNVARAFSSQADWNTVADSINSYVQSQWNTADDGEAGYLRDATTLKSQVDSNSDGTYLGEGDNTASTPVVVSVLNDGAGFVGGTSLLFDDATSNPLSSADASLLAAKVAAHKAAGMSSDVVIYCGTGATQSPIVMGYGAYSAAGGLGAPNPLVVGLKWGRAGWGIGSVSASTNTDAMGAATNTTLDTTGGLPTLGTNCNGLSGAELVRCAGELGLNGLKAAPGGDGGFPAPAPGTGLTDSYYVVDVRAGSPASTLLDADAMGTVGQIPFNQLFNKTGGTYDNLAWVNTDSGYAGGVGPVFVGRSNATSLMAAEGAQMLAVGNGGLGAAGMKLGIHGWNNTQGDNWTSAGYAGDARTSISNTDTWGSAFSDKAAATTASSATITWSTDRPATTMVELSTTPGGEPVPGSGTPTSNDTVLHKSHSATLNSLAGGTTYYYKLYNYDWNANSAVSQEYSFTTSSAAPPAPPVLTMTEPAPAAWYSLTNYTNHVLIASFRITNAPAGSDAGNVTILNTSYADWSVGILGVATSPGLAGQTITALPVNLGSIASGSSLDFYMAYDMTHATVGSGGKFGSYLKGSATYTGGTANYG